MNRANRITTKSKTLPDTVSFETSAADYIWKTLCKGDFDHDEEFLFSQHFVSENIQLFCADILNL